MNGPPLGRRVLRLVVIATFLATPFILLRFDAVRARLAELVEHLSVAGPAGWGAFLGVDVLGAILVAPLWLMSGIAGYVYGFARGFAIAMPGVALGAFAGFALGRLGLSRLFTPHASERGLVSAVHRAVEHDGVRMVLLLRVAMIPQAMLSYILATTRLRFRDYAFATTIGLVPTTLIQVYVGSIVRDVAALLEGNASLPVRWRWVALAALLVVSAIVMTLITRATRRALAAAESLPP
jgi:uncharacterized membrane protein YdjX (TVP38/TMEM64 family)